jgi:hypothetical protein
MHRAPDYGKSGRAAAKPWLVKRRGRARAPDSPMPGDGRKPEWLDPTDQELRSFSCSHTLIRD